MCLCLLYYSVNGSGWSTSGLTVDFMNDTHIRCLSTHLTTFAVLLDLTGNTVKVIVTAIRDNDAFKNGYLPCRRFHKQK